jgi:very-short-patch-repair endonuclease
MSRVYFKNHRRIILLARSLRNNQTPEEKILWELLRRRSFSGFKFLRQHPVIYREDKGWVDFFIADFYCNSLKLILELDGKIHENQKDYDMLRDEKLESRGLLVVRIKNEMTGDIEKLEHHISYIISTRAENIKNLNRLNPFPYL